MATEFLGDNYFTSDFLKNHMYHSRLHLSFSLNLTAVGGKPPFDPLGVTFD